MGVHARPHVCFYSPAPLTMAAPVYLHVLAIVAAALTLASAAYCMLCIWTAIAFSRATAREIAGTPSALVSILKPLKGGDPEMYEALHSHCLQDYPEYEILFGITEEKDPAAALVERLASEFPQRRIRLVLCNKRLGPNGKVSTLAQLAAVAAHDYLVVNDSDIRVEPSYLRTIMAELQEPETGLVTCLYKGMPGPTIGSRVEALSISTDFAPGVLVANLIEGGLHFGLGSTFAFRKRDLGAIGGFEAIVEYLADDYELGRRIVDRGFKGRLSTSVVQTHLPAYSSSEFFAHQLRWARTIRASRPGGYAGLLFTFTLPWALATVALSRGAGWAWWLFGAAVMARGVMALVSSRLVLRETLSSSFWLLPVRDFIAVAVWFGGLLGNAITWRGEKFILRGGKLVPK